MYNRNLVTEEKLAFLKEKRQTMLDKHLREMAEKYSPETADAIKYLYRLYDERIYLWLADLWDPEIGAFYYSNSARDTEGYLPDIESTCQAIAFLQHTGLYSSLGGTLDSYTPEFMKKKIVDFVISLQDEDGYFYHPQWGKDVGTSRRSRDLSWCTDTLLTMGGKAKYTTPLDKGKSEAKDLLPEHLRSVEAFKSYIGELDLYNRSYWVGNLISSQVRQIRAAGHEFEDVLIDWYNSNQCKENGLWNPEISYHSVNGLMKITMAYQGLSKPLPNAEAAFRSCVKVICNKTNNPQITSHYNPWITMSMILSNVNSFGDPALAESLKSEMTEKLPEMIRATADKVQAFQKADGSFSYKPEGSSYHSQGAPVAVPFTAEGDVNGNSLASSGIAAHIASSLGIPRIPFYTEEDSKFFFELIESASQSKKRYPRPEKMIPDKS